MGAYQRLERRVEGLTLNRYTTPHSVNNSVLYRLIVIYPILRVSQWYSDKLITTACYLLAIRRITRPPGAKFVISNVLLHLAPLPETGFVANQ